MILWLLTILLVPVGLLAQRSPGESNNSQVKTPNALIESGAVSRVLIFHVADSVSTRGSLSPQGLMSIAGSAFEITTDIKERFRPVFSGVSFQNEKCTPDLRWGILFYDVRNREIGEVFVDQFGHYGYVNGEVGSFAGDHPGFNIAKELHTLTGDRR
jgi:hypothetical protein